jgi:hypothetical protein
MYGDTLTYLPNIFKNMHLLGAPQMVGEQTYFFRVVYSNNALSQIWYDDLTAVGDYIIKNYDYIKILIVCAQGCNIGATPIVFKPMIIDDSSYNAGFTDYQPYAMSNAELTAKVQTNITIIWDYNANNNGEIPYEPFTSTLSDNINNYDAIQLEMVSYRDDLDTSEWNATMFSPIMPVYVLNNSFKNNYFNHTSFETRSTNWYIKDTTIQKVANNFSDINGLVRVYGIKF